MKEEWARKDSKRYHQMHLTHPLSEQSHSFFIFQNNGYLGRTHRLYIPLTEELESHDHHGKGVKHHNSKHSELTKHYT